MMNKTKLEESLTKLGLNEKEIEVYLYLVTNGGTTPLDISRGTKVNRTTAYRILDKFNQMSLVSETLEGKTSIFEANDPKSLHSLLVQKESELQLLKQTLNSLVEDLSSIQCTKGGSSKVLHYRGKEGVKQLLWNTLSANDEVVGYGYIDWNAVVGRIYAERLRQEYVYRKLKAREVQNFDIPDYTEEDTYKKKLYQLRIIPESVLKINHDTYIYNNVYAVCYFYKEEYWGVEIYNENIANAQKQIFEILWKIAKSKS
jgi:sugar-specific transcriptional regulator TrmB